MLDLDSVTVIIVNYNAGSLLTRCVHAALEQARQVIVVDNASSDSSVLNLESEFSLENRLCIIRSESNIGFAAGCNKGLNAATQPYILFLNPDCMLQSGTLKHLVQVLESDSCLLYTSPSPRDGLLSRMPSSA